MSQENVETVRLAYERVNRGDIDGFLQECAADIEFRDLPDLPGSGLFIGRDAVRAWYEQLTDAFEGLRFEGKTFIEAGEHVVVESRATGRGKGSGADVELSFSMVWTLSNEKLIRGVAYGDHAEALAAVERK
jgi:ketosteroid isomerase-like protein